MPALFLFRLDLNLSYYRMILNQHYWYPIRYVWSILAGACYMFECASIIYNLIDVIVNSGLWVLYKFVDVWINIFPFLQFCVKYFSLTT